LAPLHPTYVNSNGDAMSEALFQFWSEAGKVPGLHPRDDADARAAALIRKHFKTECLFGSYMGPLKSAPVVFLYTHPGLADMDEKIPLNPKDQEINASWRSGTSPLPGPDDHKSAWDWWTNAIRQFDIGAPEAWKDLRNKIAIFNIFAYHCGRLNNPAFSPRIPSCRVAHDWAHQYLFPKARRGDTLVVCMAAATQWGLKRGAPPVGQLFTPEVNPAGLVYKNNEYAVQFRAIVEAAQRCICSCSGRSVLGK
jgi:hypothetical protein